MASNNLSPSTPTDSSTVKSATIALVGIAYFLIVDAALYVMNSRYELLVVAFGGGRSVGPYGVLAVSAFFGLGVGSLALVIGLYRGARRRWLTWIGLLLLAFWGAGMLIAGIFPADEPGSTVCHITTVRIAGIFPVDAEGCPETQYGFIHLFAILFAFLALTLAAVVLSWDFRRDEKWHGVRQWVLALALVMMIACIVFVREVLYPSNRVFDSISPGAFILAGLAAGLLWLLLMAARLRLIAIGAVARR